MGFLDILIIIVVLGFSLFGLWFGLIHTLGSLLGTVLGIYLASRYYEIGAQWLMGITGWEHNFARVIMFIIAFILINRAVGILFYLVDRALSVITRLPIIKGFNRLFGLIFGFLEGVITIGVIVYFIERFPLSETFMQYLAESTIAPYVVKVSSVFLPLLPQALKMLESTVDYVENIVI